MSQVTATLLVVDDDANNQDVLSRRLIRSGYRVLIASSGEEALEMINAQRFDAVLLDVMMPGMSGVEALRRLRQSRSMSELPVIMVTANNRSEDVVEALGLGANDYITKPIDFPIALARIKTQVTARRADPLTGLPNRSIFLDQLDRVIAGRSAGRESTFAVYFLDVDRFKLINDSLGHLAGDEVLVGIAARLEKVLRSTDGRLGGEHALARLGGDEFTILLEGLSDAAEARALGEQLLAAITQPFTVKNRDIFVSASIGVVLADDRYQRSGEMVRDADMAMYRAKSLGKARCEVFDTSMLAIIERRLQIESGLRHALERDELSVFYQPIVSLRDAQIRGFEALLRWHHPTLGIVVPSECIPIAEETGLILPIGHWVLEQACRQMCEWDREFGSARGLTMSVNLSARQCMHPELVRDVRRVLAETGLPPHRLKLEITEGVVLENSDAMTIVLNDLRALGVQLGLDDFGTGYSALNYLQRFPFQTIKIDRTCVHAMHEGGNEIIRAIIALARALAMDVSAEGVETIEQLTSLKGLSCEFGQGHYFDEALPAAAAEKLLRALPHPVAQSTAPSLTA